jgi:uncharacterized protein
MALSKQLKEILACPKCKGSLEYREEQAEIRCKACRLAYPIHDDIPVMLHEQAKPIKE